MGSLFAVAEDGTIATIAPDGMELYVTSTCIIWPIAYCPSG
jgi:hypothetical protein